MEFNIEVFKKIVSLIDDAKKNKNYELEARFMNKNNILIHNENFNTIFQKLTFSKENNGFGYKYEMMNILDIILSKSNNMDNIRMSINGTDNIKKYWLDTKFEGLPFSFIEKEKIDKIDDDDYNIRFSLNNELPQNNILEKNIDLLQSNEYEKMYRLKNRYHIITNDNLFSIDMSSVKMGYGKTFKDSNTLKEIPKYEIEIEYIGKDILLSNEEIAKRLLKECQNILKLLQNNDILLSNRLANVVKESYYHLVHSTHFIAANPVTIHVQNVIKNDNIKNIYQKYAVTLKADGTRFFLFCLAEKDQNNNGRIFLFNNNFEVYDTGYVDKNFTNTLIEGELVEFNGEKDFFIYDILFMNGEDVRRRHLVHLHKAEKEKEKEKEKEQKSRLALIDEFIKSSTRHILENYNEKNCIHLKKKQYLFSVRNDGTDIFQKINEIWSMKNQSPFHVDGIIMTPIYEYYPLKFGSWNSLFKWKPPQLNTIDFLIEIVKDDNNRDVKSPYIEVINRPDGKKETIIKQYKTVRLYVTGQKQIFNGSNNNETNYKKSYQNRKNIPVLFNPFGTNNENSSIYNTVKIMINDDEKIYANDPITNEVTEIMDDIIVEFGYDNTMEDGFKWRPYRYRRDKTNLYKSERKMFGNSERTANDIFRAINNPITEEMITTGNIPFSQEISTQIELSNHLGKEEPYYAGLEVGNTSKTERFAYQNFHNHYIKYQLFYYSSPLYMEGLTGSGSGTRGKILDLCCGKGVDINKIKRAKYSEIVGMDIDLTGIKVAQERYRTIIPMPKPKAYYVRGDSRKLIWPEQATAFTEADKIYTKKYIPMKYYFDTVSIQFCFHYFLENEITFRTILQNINDNLKIGGHVIGTCFDGERIYKSLEGKGTIQGKTPSGEILWKIDKKYSTTKLVFDSKKSNFGKKIDVFVKSIGQVHTEYLVNFNYVDKMMEEYGFKKVMIKPFEEFYNELIDNEKELIDNEKEKKQNSIMDLSEKELQKDIDNAERMTEDQKRFSFLSSGFIYKKEKNSSDILIKKLFQLMEKEKKVKKKDGVFLVDKNMEHSIEDLEEDGVL